MSINLSSINLNNSQKAISFKAKIKDPVFAKKHLQALLTQDIYSPKLKIKRPETTLEKETLIEILKNRLNLDKYVRLTNERFLAITSIFLINEMIHNNNTNNDEYKNLRAEIDKKGNLKSYFNTLDKSIEMETKKNKHSIDFFKEIEKNEEELIEKKLLKPNELNKFYEQVTKYNINKDGNLSTKELLEIIEKDINTNDSQKKS